MTRFGVIPIRRLRCAKCGSPPQTLTETGSITMQFCVSRDGAYRDAEGVQEPGDVERLDATCACGHRWRIRNAIQVTSVDTGPEIER